MGDVIHARIVFSDAVVAIIELLLLVVAVARGVLAAILACVDIIVGVDAVGVALTDVVTVPLIGDRIRSAASDTGQRQHEEQKRNGFDHFRAALAARVPTNCLGLLRGLSSSGASGRAQLDPRLWRLVAARHTSCS